LGNMQVVAEVLACSACGSAADNERVVRLRTVTDYEDLIVQPWAHHSYNAPMSWHLVEEETPSQPSSGWPEAQTGRQQTLRERTPTKGDGTASPRLTPRILSKEDRVRKSTEMCLPVF